MTSIKLKLSKQGSSITIGEGDVTFSNRKQSGLDQSVLKKSDINFEDSFYDL
jgi:hypothetical protein